MATFTGQFHGGQEIVLFTTSKYSPTTSGHLSLAHRALSGVLVLDVPYIDGIGQRNTDNMASFQTRIDEQALRLSRCHSGVSYILSAIYELQTDSEVYNTYFMDGKGTPCTLPENLDELVRKAQEREARKAEKDQQREIARRAAWEEWRRIDALGLEEKVTAWREGKAVLLPYSAPVMLRMRGDQVETSMGAVVPLDHAERLYRIICKCKMNETTFEANGHSIPIGVYKVDRIDVDGTLHAGCHHINFEEIQRFAKERGWTK
jgi:hypothetical protein